MKGIKECIYSYLTFIRSYGQDGKDERMDERAHQSIPATSPKTGPILSVKYNAYFICHHSFFMFFNIR